MSSSQTRPDWLDTTGKKDGRYVIGPLLGFEVLTAFFLEASFLGVMLFGWGKVSPKMHFASTIIVAAGTLLSAFWILSANSWMQTPQGHGVNAEGLGSDWESSRAVARPKTNRLRRGA